MTLRVHTRTASMRLLAVAVGGWLMMQTLASPPAASADQDTPGPQADPSAATLHGFLRQTDGEFSAVEPPDATSAKPSGVNNRGDLIFKYLVADGTQLGAQLSKDTFRPIAVPGGMLTAPLGQNDRGDVVGNFLDAAGASHGFLLSRDGEYTVIDDPDASGAVLDTPGTIVTNINNSGEMVGIFSSNGKMVGFKRDRTGNFTSLDRPGAVATYIGGINEHGQIVGTSSSVGPGELLFGGDGDAFLLEDGTYQPVAFPGARDTFLNTLNNQGDIVGGYIDSDGRGHGLRRDAKGAYTSIDHPDDTGGGTSLYSINDRGQISGAYAAAGGDPQAAQQARQSAATPMKPLLTDMGRVSG